MHRIVAPASVICAVVVCAVVAGAAAAGCSTSRRAEAPLPPIDPTRLSHERHAQLPCEACHRGAARPGADDHKPCDDGACHQREFLGPPGKLCEVCHTAITAQPLAAPLKPYPLGASIDGTDDTWQAMPPVFSHARHLDAGRMEARVGFHVACADCHVDADGALTRPDHATCARCHAPEAGLPRGPTMADCAGCHQPGARPRVRRRLVRGDIKFEHARHRADRKNQGIRCEACHATSAQSASYADHRPPRVESCVGCHDDSERVPPRQRMRACETCHLERAATLTAIAPRSHLPSTERPLDHTLAFRRDHAEVAARSAQRCAACHTQMSGHPRQACDECHQNLLPADHRITWRELDHGPEAIAKRDRCATCHVVEFCSACHAQRPRSHGHFGGPFLREHGRLARINIRACMTCHEPSTPNPRGGTCIAPGCHTGIR